MSSDRETEKQAFLTRAGLADARRAPLPGDASTRHYERLLRDGKPTLMLMDSPAGSEDEPLGADATDEMRIAAGYNATSRLSGNRIDAFVAAATYLRSRGLSAPKIIAFDVPLGFCVAEDLGEGLYARLIERGEPEEPLYMAAVEALAQLHDRPPPAVIGEDGARWPLLPYDNLALKTGADLFIDWLPKFEPRVVIGPDEAAQWDDLWSPIRQRAELNASVFTHRDYHAENLIWLPERSGVARVGMVDIQDCVLGTPGWDLFMLLQDARRDVPPALEAKALAHYFDLRPDTDQGAFLRDYAALAALNEARILGVFSRLIVRDGKPRYRAFMPRMWRHLEANLNHPDLAGLKAWFDRHVPQEVRA